MPVSPKSKTPSVAEQILLVLQSASAPVCLLCLVEQTGRSRSGLLAAAKRLEKAKTIGRESDRTCPRCRTVRVPLLWLRRPAPMPGVSSPEDAGKTGA